MCNYTKLKESPEGYLTRCNGCKRVQVVSGNVVASYTDKEFHAYLDFINELYERHKLYACRDHKMILVPTATKSVTMICSVNEIYSLLCILVQGRNKMEYAELLTYCEN